MTNVTTSNRDVKIAAASDGIPAGDLPPQPRWPLILSAVLWGLWIVFLFAMMWMRIRATPV